MATNELRADIRITGENAAKRGLKDVGDAADRAGDKLEAMGHDANFLSKQIADAETQYKQLIREFDKTGDVDLLKGIRKEKRQFRLFEGLKRELQKEIEEAAEQAKKMAEQGLATSVVAPVIAAKPALVGALIAVAAATAPFLGGVIASAVLGATGIGGIVGGFALATRDQRVKDAAHQLGSTALDAFTNAASGSFVDPAVESLNRLEQASVRVADKLGEGFSNIAPVTVPLTEGLIGFVEDFMPGFVKGLEEAKPVIRVIADELPDIGHALGDMIETMGKDSDGAVLAFEALSKILQATLRTFGDWVAGLSMAYEWSVRTGASVTGALEDVAKWAGIVSPLGPVLSGIFADSNDDLEGLLKGLDEANDSSHDFTSGLYGMGDAAKRAADEIAEIKAAIDDLFNVTMGMEEANVRWAQGLRELTKELDEGKKTIALNSEEGLKNRKALDEQIKAAEEYRDAQIAIGVPIDQANQKYLEQVEALRQLALKAGFARTEVDKFFEQWMRIPEARTIQLNLKAGGDAAAWAALRNLERSQDFSGAGRPLSPGVLEYRAGGGSVMPGRGYIVGENGPEFFSPNTSGQILTAAQMSGASGGAGRPVLNLTYQPSGDALLDAFMAMFWPRILRQVRLDGGDLAAFGAA